MAKSTSCKEAIANFEKTKGLVAAETEKVSCLLCYDAGGLRTVEQLEVGCAGFALWPSSSYRQNGCKSFFLESLQVSLNTRIRVLET